VRRYYAELANKQSGVDVDAESLSKFYGIPQVKTKEGLKTGRWWNGAVVPITFLTAVLPLMYYSGACAASWGGMGNGASFADAIGNADPYAVLIWLALLLICVMMLMYFVQGAGTYFNCQTKGENGARISGPFAPLLWPKEIISAACEQVGLMWEVFVVLIFARCIGNIVKMLGMPKFIECSLGDMDPGAIPATVFVLGAINSLGTGTSWGTMAVLFPAAIPLAITVARAQTGGVDNAFVQESLVTTIAAVLGGAIWGDHCSLISDTTLLSALACRVTGWDHFKTQFPYAAYCGIMSILLGYLPRGYGMPSGLGIAFGLIVSPAISYGITFIPKVGGPVPVYKPAEGKIIGEGTTGVVAALKGYFKKIDQSQRTEVEVEKT
jgi:Na+/H+ antiporter NhaC